MTVSTPPEPNLTIREMCELFKVTPRTLRFYEAKELLAPIRQGQRRLFTRRDRARMTLIQRGKRFGFSLEEIRQLLNLYNIGDGQVQQIRRTLEIANERLHEMQQRRAELDSAIAELKSQISEGQTFLDHVKTQHKAAE